MIRQYLAGVLSVIALGASQAGAAERSVGLNGGAVDPSGFRLAPCFSIDIRWAAEPRLLVAPEVGYWTRSDSNPDVTNKVTDMSAGIVLIHPLTKGRSSLQALIGGGVAAHLISSSSAVLGYDEAEDTQLKHGIALLLEVQYRLSSGVWLAGGVRSDLVADLVQSKVYGGLRFTLSDSSRR